MKKNKYELLKGIIGILLCVTSVAGIYYWESYGREEYVKEEVVVLKTSVKPLTVITNKDLTLVKIEKSGLIENPITNKKEIVGKVSKHFIPARGQLTSEYFEAQNMMPNEGEYIFQMPSDWIATLPSTLRRSDDAYLYPVLLDEGQDVGLSVEKKDPIKCLRIAFVRNQANQEVESVNGSDRLVANSNISKIELIASIEDINELSSMRSEGYKFIVMYR
ncbi:SAF domain-containing protein [Fusibacter sp. JL216-2]|uniref:SAF domain-containing protein n=1 Tax=Fusibacter sp. JL216-2 TaxID=3071453 RepID=UPI003D3313DC